MSADLLPTLIIIKFAQIDFVMFWL